MANKPRNFLSETIHHVYNRAVEKRKIFYSNQDFEFFIKKILFYQMETEVNILAYSILPNHFHFLLKEPTSKVADLEGRNKAISRFISLLLNSYTRYFNLKYQHSGRIFQGPFKSKIVNTDSYLQNLVNYINLNPLKHGIVGNIEEWPYTSHHEYLNNFKFKIINQDYLIDLKEYGENLKNYIENLKNIDEEFNLEGCRPSRSDML